MFDSDVKLLRNRTSWTDQHWISYHKTGVPDNPIVPIIESQNLQPREKVKCMRHNYPW